MDMLEVDHRDFDPRSAEADRALMVRFYTAPLRNDTKSAEEGRPIFDDVDMIEIRVRGTKDNIVQRPLREDDKRRFREAYRAHLDGEKAHNTGTPLSQWPIMSASQVEEMKYLGFHTVEQIANANDGVVSSIKGLQGLKNRAKLFIEFSKGAAPLEQLQLELEAAKNLNETNQNAMAQMIEEMKQLRAQVTALEGRASVAAHSAAPDVAEPPGAGVGAPRAAKTR